MSDHITLQDVCAPEKPAPKLSPAFAGGCYLPATPGEIQCQDDEVSTLQLGWAAQRGLANRMSAYGPERPPHPCAWAAAIGVRPVTPACGGRGSIWPVS